MEISKENIQAELEEHLQRERFLVEVHLRKRAQFNWFKGKVIQAVLLCNEQGVLPKRLALTNEDEAFLVNSCTAETVGPELVGKIHLEGIRAALPKIFGLTTIWDAEKTEVLP